MMAGADWSKVLLVGGRGKERRVGFMLDRYCSPTLERWRWLEEPVVVLLV